MFGFQILLLSEVFCVIRVGASVGAGAVSARDVRKILDKDRLIFLRRLVGTVEHAVERVVIGRGNGVEFMIVATGAIHGEAHRAPGDHINAVINNLVATRHLRTKR